MGFKVRAAVTNTAGRKGQFNGTVTDAKTAAEAEAATREKLRSDGLWVGDVKAENDEN
jgi:hypothetical protein